ncbi:ABC transporter ATP-binding protein [bacterium]|nr:ABC transporter ATP-binding protein [bacterium]
MAGLTVRKLSKSFDDTVVLNDISFELGDSELLVLLGPSGCGKSTLLRIIAGLEEADEGEIYINSKRVDQLRPRDRNVALVFQNYSLYPHMTIEQNLAFPLKVAKVPKGERVERIAEIASKLGLTDQLKKKPGQLSGGQRQRVALGRAIVRRPSIYLLDEPLSNLDADLRVRMRREIVALQRDQRRPMVHVTHDQAEALTMADRIALLHGGVTQQLGTPEELYADPANQFVAEFIGQPKINIVRCQVRDGRLIPFGSDLAECSDRDVIVGIRPESIRLGPQFEFTGTVEGCEYMGDQYVATLRFKEIRLVVAKLAESVEIGADVRFGFYSSALLFFDPPTGERLRFR